MKVEIIVSGALQIVSLEWHDEESYDRAVELEEIGGQVMELKQKVWAD